MGELKVEGFGGLLGGANAGVPPTILGDTYFWKGVNVSVRGGLLSTRPGFKKLLSIPAAGVFRGAGVYRLNSGDSVVIAAGEDVVVQAMSGGEPATFSGVFPGSVAQAHFVQADKYFVVQSGVVEPYPQWPLILDGTERVDNLEVLVFDDVLNGIKKVGELEQAESKRVPIGTVMAYGHGRLFVATNRVWNSGALTGGTPGWVKDLGYRFFVAGDIIQPDNAAEILAFIENEYVAEGGAFSLAAEMGFINGMACFRNSATGSGLGALIVFARDGLSGFAVNTPRAQWKTVDIGQVLFTGIGTDSPWTIVSLNDDLFFRSRDGGLRTVKYTTSQVAGASGSLSCAPMSREMEYVLALDDGATRKWSSAAWVGNRVLVTTGGVVQPSGEVHFRGIVSLDTSPIGALQQSASPAYDGVWTGKNVLQVLRARVDDTDVPIVLAREDDGSIGVYQLAAAGHGEEISCRVQTRAFSWGDQQTLKQVNSAEVWLRDLRGEVSVTAYWRPDGYPLWLQMNTVRVRASESGLAQHRYRILLAPQQGMAMPGDPVTGLRLDRGTTFQFCLEWTGQATVEKCLFYAEDVVEERKPLGCSPETEIIAVAPAVDGIELSEFGD